MTQVVGSVTPHHTWDKALQVGPMDHALTSTTIVLKHQHMYRVDDVVTILLRPVCCCAFWEHLHVNAGMTLATLAMHDLQPHSHLLRVPS
jgi:hypothetical protein